MSSSKSDEESASSSKLTPAPTVLTPEFDSDDSSPTLAAVRTSGGETSSSGADVGGASSSEGRRLHQHLHGPRKEEGDDEQDGMLSEDSFSEEAEEDRLYGSLKKRSPAESEDYYSEEEEAMVVRKLDRKLIMFLAFLYMLSFLDRSNIGNARIAGLEADLSLSSAQYDWLLTAFYLTYITFEWMILLYQLVPAHVYISLCVASWGLAASLQSLVSSFGQLVCLRALLGITEAAFGPGVPLYMSFFYKRSELAYRVGLQISAAPLASSFASSLAWVIVKVSQNGPVAPWRALFLVEGFPSVLAAVAAWYYIPDGPEKARYLTEREREVAVARVKADHHSASHAHHEKASAAVKTAHRFHLKDILPTVLDPKSYLSALMFLSVNVSFSSLPVFLPTIINSMDFSPLASQALAAPPYLFAFFFVIFVGRCSDRIPDSRAFFLMGAALLSALSYAGIAVAGSLHESLGEAGSITIRYVAVYGAAMGLFASVTLIITWTLNNQATATGRGTGLTILNLVGQGGPLVGVHVFPKSQGPFYVQGMTVCACFMAFGVAGLAAALRLVLWRANKKNGFGGNPVVGGEYELVGKATDEADGLVHDAEQPEDVEETLIGGGRKINRPNAGFRYML